MTEGRRQTTDDRRHPPTPRLRRGKEGGGQRTEDNFELRNREPARRVGVRRTNSQLPHNDFYDFYGFYAFYDFNDFYGLYSVCAFQ